MTKTKTKKKIKPVKATRAAKATKPRASARTVADPYDGIFAFKLALYVVAGSIWLKLNYNNMMIPLPIGLIAGMTLASRERFKTDRKIDYAVLLIAALFGFWAPFGLYVSF